MKSITMKKCSSITAVVSRRKVRANQEIKYKRDRPTISKKK